MRPLRVFISATKLDLGHQRAAVTERVRKMGHDTVIMENVPSRAVSGLDHSLEQVAESHILVGLIGWRYGFIPKGHSLSITEREYLGARELGIPTLMFLGDESLRKSMADDHGLDDHPEKSAAFRAKILDECVVNWFDEDVDILCERVEAALRDIAAEPTAREFWVGGRPRKEYFGHRKELQRLHSLLYRSPARVEQGFKGIKPVAITGMAGVGKTELALEYSYTRYPTWRGGGIFWLSAEGNNLTSEAAKLARTVQLGIRSGSMEEDADAFVHHLHQTPLETLLVLDNVSDPAELRNLHIGSLVIRELACNILITTRQSLLDNGAFDELPLDVLDRGDAIEFLLHRVPQRSTGIEGTGERRAAEQICDRVGHLPMALAIASAHLGEYYPQVTPSKYLSHLIRAGALGGTDDAAKELGNASGAGIAAALRLDWQSLEARDPSSGIFARHVLRVAAQFGEGAALTFGTLRRSTDLALVNDDSMGGIASPLMRGLRRLTRHSLIELSSTGHYRLHPLVRLFASGPEVDPLADSRAAFAERVATTLAQTLCSPPELDLMIQEEGADAALAELAVARELASSALNVRVATGGFEYQDEGSAALISASDALARWQRCLQREAHMLLGVFVRFPELGRRESTPHAKGARQASSFIWQQLRNSAFELSFVDVVAAAEGYLSELAAGFKWLRLEHPPFREQVDALERTLVAHEASIDALAWSLDGMLIASGDAQGDVRVWSPQQISERAILRNQGGGVLALAWRPENSRQLIALGCRDGKARLWEVRAAESRISFASSVLAVLEKHDDAVTVAAWDLEGKTLITAGRDGLICCWAVDQDANLISWQPTTSSIRAIALHPRGRLLVSGSSDGLLRLWQLDAHNHAIAMISDPFAAHEGAVSAVDWSSNGALMASSGEDGGVRLWKLHSHDRASGAESLVRLGQPTRFDGQIRSLAWMRSSLMLACGGSSGSLRFLSVDEGAPESGFRVLPTAISGHSSAIHRVAWSPTGDRMLTAGQDKRIHQWHVDALLAQADVPRLDLSATRSHEEAPSAFAIDQMGTRIVMASQDGMVQFWKVQDSLDCQIESTVRVQPGVRVLAFSPDRQAIALGGGPRDRTIRVVSTKPRQKSAARTLRKTEASGIIGLHEESVAAVEWNADSSLIASCAGDVVRVWTRHQSRHYPEPMHEFRDDDDLRALAWHHERNVLAAAGRAGVIRIYDVGTDVDGEPISNEKVARPNASSSLGRGIEIVKLAWDLSGRQLACGTRDGTIYVWFSPLDANASSPACLRGTHEGPLSALAWSPDSEMLASAGEDCTVCIWDIAAESRLGLFPTRVHIAALIWQTLSRSILLCELPGPSFRPGVSRLHLVGSGG